MPIFISCSKALARACWGREKIGSVAAEAAKKRIKCYFVSSRAELIAHEAAYLAEPSSLVIIPGSERELLDSRAEFARLPLHVIVFAHHYHDMFESEFSYVMSDLSDAMQCAIRHLQSRKCTSPALFAVLATSCLGTAVWEEIAFRRLAMEAVAGALEEGRARRLMAACVCSAVFAMLHLPEMGAALPTALRAAQVFLFALAMTGLVEQAGRLVPAIAAHALYDAICFAPAVLGISGSTWEISASSLMTLETSISGMLASLLFLAPAAVLGVRRLLAAR